MPRRRRTPGVFCLEGAWTSKLTERSSIEPMLQLLARRNKIEYFHDRVHTASELLHLAGRWPQKQYADYSVGYFAFHGSPGTIHLGRQQLTLDELGQELRGKLTGKVIHFGSCAVFDAPAKDLERFRKTIGARAVTGYRNDVDWMQSTAFDMLFLDAFAYYTQMDAIERDVRRQAAGLAKALRFRVVRAPSRRG